jgi:hypothetical protein
MSRILFALIFIFAVSGCQNEQNARYRTSSSEIDLLKKGIEAYEKADWQSWKEQYADSAKIFQNSWHGGVSPEEIQKKHIDLISNLSNYGFIKEDIVMQQIVDDQGKTWVNFWGLWRCTLKANDKTVDIPVHLSIQFSEGKIVKEYGFWNFSILKVELQTVKSLSG